MSSLRRLIALPGVADLEYKALMKPRMADPDARTDFPEIDACVKANFGLSADEAEAAKPADWDGVDEKPANAQVFAFEDAGWDVTDDRRKPLRTLAHFAGPMWLAIRGVAGTLPAGGAPPEEKDDSAAWGSNLAAEATRFRRDRR